MQKLPKSAFFYNSNIIKLNLIGSEMLKPEVTLYRPIHIGQAVLDYSKLHMYKLFYHALPSCPLIHDIHLLRGDTNNPQLASTSYRQTFSKIWLMCGFFKLS